MLIYGINPVLEALRAGRVKELCVSERAGGRAIDAIKSADREGIAVRRVTPGELDRLTHGGVHQGIAADVRPVDRYDVGDLVQGARDTPLIVVLDGIEDPHNVGAILRTADAAGADGVIRQSRRAAPLDGVAAKASAGSRLACQGRGGGKHCSGA